MTDITKPRIVIIVQARIGATRLPGKPLIEVLDQPLLYYLVERLKKVQHVEEVVIATSTSSKDEPIVEFCRLEEIPLFRGSENDVLDRYVNAAHAFAAQAIIRITADCPLVDPAIIDKVTQFYLDHYPNYDFVSNTLKRTYPRGMDVEIFSFEAISDADLYATFLEEREHVTPYLYRHSESYRLGNVTNEIDESNYRLCVDTADDLTLIKKIIEELYPKNPSFTLADILMLFKTYPDWFNINAHVKQKEI